MKHLFLLTNIGEYMVYYPPKKKALMYETILKAKQNYKYGGELTYPQSIIKALQNNGFKCVDVSSEITNKFDIYADLEKDSIVYRGILINLSQYSGYSFWVGKTLNTCLTLEEAINTIDKELR